MEERKECRKGRKRGKYHLLIHSKVPAFTSRKVPSQRS